MTRVDLEAPFRLDDTSWTIYFNGLDVNQDLLLIAGPDSILVSDPDADTSRVPFFSLIPGKRLAFHVDLAKIPASVQRFSFQISARKEAFLDWSVRAPSGTHFDSEGLRVFSGSHLEVLEISRNEIWEIKSRRVEVGVEPIPLSGNRRLPETIRELHRLAGNLMLAHGSTNVAAVVDSSASMLKIQQHPNFHVLIEAIRAISLTVTFRPLQIRFAGISENVGIGPLDDVSRTLEGKVIKDHDEFREVEPMMTLVPSALSDSNLIAPGGKLYCLSDTWFFMGKDLGDRLEELDISLVLVKILQNEQEDEPIRFSHPRVTMKTLIGLEQLENASTVLRNLA